MSYNREVIAIQNDLQRAWTGIRAALGQMYPASEVRPGDAADVFRAETAEKGPRFRVGPVVFKLPEKPNSRQPRLYVVIKGWIGFAPPIEDDPRRTTFRYGTEVGYFRASNDHLAHVYGAHYDMVEDLLGHPVFHAQMTTEAELKSAIEEQFHVRYENVEDRTGGLLRNVRTPTAQMDVFSVITQIGADHLVSESSGSEVQVAFTRLRKAGDFFLGAAGRLPYLNHEQAARCFRSTHWYEGNAAPENAAVAGSSP